MAHHKEHECDMRNVSCPNCKVTLKFKDAAVHANLCEAPVQCVHCKSMIAKKNKEYHENVCPEMIIGCPNSNTSGDFTCSGGGRHCAGDRCHYRVARKNMGPHVANACQFRMISCNLCQDRVQEHFQSTHQTRDCSQYPLTCEKCNERYVRAENHRARCRMEPVECRWQGCDDKYFRHYIATHERRCQYRLVACKYCSARVQHFTLSRHNQKCRSFPITCRHCHEDGIPRCDIGSHNDECPELNRGNSYNSYYSSDSDDGYY